MKVPFWLDIVDWSMAQISGTETVTVPGVPYPLPYLFVNWSDLKDSTLEGGFPDWIWKCTWIDAAAIVLLLVVIVLFWSNEDDDAEEDGQPTTSYGPQTGEKQQTE